ncbi:MAG: hypothetical protein AAFU64_04880, partial [Bacteroidota bacterium]
EKLNFAFTCIEAKINRDGDFTLLPFNDPIIIEARSVGDKEAFPMELPKVRFYSENGLLDFDAL